MQNEIIINAERGETRVAVLEQSSFNELHIERDEDTNVVGSVVKGRVGRVLPGMQAAFVDIGLEKAAFLYAGDYFANGFMDGADEESGVPTEPPRRGRHRSRQPPRIDTLLKEDQEIVVQIAKQPIGTKGPAATSRTASAAPAGSGDRPRLVCNTTPVAFTTGRGCRRESRSASSQTRTCQSGADTSCGALAASSCSRASPTTWRAASVTAHTGRSGRVAVSHALSFPTDGRPRLGSGLTAVRESTIVQSV